MFRGSAPAKIDDKGRLKIPTDFRRYLEERYGLDLFVTSVQGDSALLYPLPVWEEIEAHLPVLVAETLAALAPERGGLYVDATVGLGGHAEAILQAAPAARLVGIDRDGEALALAARRLAPFGDRLRLAQGTFDRLPELLA